MKTYKAIYKGFDVKTFPAICNVKDDIFHFVVYDRDGKEHIFKPYYFHQLFTILCT